MGDDSRVREVYVACYPRLVAQLCGVCGDLAEAEDVVQEAFAKAVIHTRAFAAADNPEAWLRRVAVNVARSRWRRARKAVDLYRRVGQPANAPPPDDHTLLVVAALGRLPRAQREVLALHHLADLPVREVAATLGVPEGTVKARLSRGRAALRQLLAEEVAHD